MQARQLRQMASLSVFLILLALHHARAAPTQMQCPSAFTQPTTADYSKVFSAPRTEKVYMQDLPGFTRTAYYKDHALIAPESRVWASHVGWHKALVAHLISPATGAYFSMYLANITAGGRAAPATFTEDVERFVLVLQGSAEVSGVPDGKVKLPTNHYAYFPPNSEAKLACANGCGLLVYERYYMAKGEPSFQHGYVEDSPLLETPGEVFELRKLLPTTVAYDFNIHIMDFKPGEFLNVKEVHYNQHGLLMLEGQGIYRLGDKWYPVQAGDAIWMAPYTLQWYGALGTTRTRYVIIKDTTLDPLIL